MIRVHVVSRRRQHTHLPRTIREISLHAVILTNRNNHILQQRHKANFWKYPHESTTPFDPDERERRKVLRGLIWPGRPGGAAQLTITMATNKRPPRGHAYSQNTGDNGQALATKHWTWQHLVKGTATDPLSILLFLFVSPFNQQFHDTDFFFSLTGPCRSDGEKRRTNILV